MECHAKGYISSCYWIQKEWSINEGLLLGERNVNGCLTSGIKWIVIFGLVCKNVNRRRRRNTGYSTNMALSQMLQSFLSSSSSQRLSEIPSVPLERHRSFWEEGKNDRGEKERGR